MLNALRLNQPIFFDQYKERTGLNIFDIQPQLELAWKRNLIVYDDHQLRTTAMGKRFLMKLRRYY